MNCFAILLAFVLSSAKVTSFKVKLVDNGYNNVVIAIHEHIPADQKLLENIKNMVTRASGVLYNATRKRAFFRDVKILIPRTWGEQKGTQTPTYETYNQANVFIAKSSHRDGPYTLQYGGCGKEGRYIHFTPDFLLNDAFINNYGPREKVFVHEWAHLRWGVFNEYDESTPFYRPNLKSRLESTRCPKDIKGDFCMPSRTPGDCSPCDDESPDLCVFTPHSTQNTNVSMMFMPSLASVNMFCDSESHNAEAPNDQNRKCDYRSTWDVISESEDFKDNSNKPIYLDLPTPTFTLLQPKNRVFCLVLDVSGSMNAEGRLTRLRQASVLFLKYIIEEDSKVAIVTFNSNALIKRYLTNISDDDTRNQLIKDLPTTAEGGTNICSGLQMGFQVLEKDGSSEGGEIILLTDGEDSSVGSCFDEVKNKGTKIHGIALGPNAEKDLEKFPQMTGGFMFSTSDTFSSNGLLDAFMEISEDSLQLENTGKDIEPKGSFVGKVEVDSAVGNKTTFLVTWKTDSTPTMLIIDPDRKEYKNNDFKIEEHLHIGTLQIPYTAKKGTWMYNISNTDNNQQNVALTVLTKPSDSKNSPVLVNTYQKPGQPATIFVEIFQDYSPVINAEVTAIIETEKGSSSIQLYDSGSGADLIRNDGIYSVFFRPTTKGRHGFKVRVESIKKQSKQEPALASHAMYVRSYFENGALHWNPPKPPVSDNLIPVEDFSRTKSGGAFIVTEVPPAGEDVYPPCRITDFAAAMENDTVMLSWTAPGDDLDEGTALEYELRISGNVQELRDRFHNATKVNTTAIRPLPARSKEEFSFVPEMTNDTVIYLAIRALDETGLASGLSNIEQVTIAKPAVPTTTANIKDDNKNTARNKDLILGIAVASVAGGTCLIIGVIAYAVQKRRSGQLNIGVI
ncbi:calcium-activated chloride channel regulator 2-like [Huso huso]|uniref:Calcium-activated chloride channel regulator 2-like n=1 Tax=Huso huso TaxID=61971 RepID=A0ABR0ZHS9_HUSHU